MQMQTSSAWESFYVMSDLILARVSETLATEQSLESLVRQLLEMLDEIRTSYDLSIFLSTHDFATLGQFADKVILLKGTVLRVGPPDEVLASPEFQEVFHLNLGKGNLGKGGRG